MAPCVRVGSAESPSYLDGIIMGTDEVREIAKAAGVRRIVLTHNGGANSPQKRKPFIEAVGEVLRLEQEFTGQDIRRSFAVRFVEELQT